MIEVLQPEVAVKALWVFVVVVVVLGNICSILLNSWPRSSCSDDVSTYLLDILVMSKLF